MSKLIVIVGVTGNQGGSVAQTFLKEPGWKIRGITRNPSKPSNKALLDAGVELVAADLDDPTTLLAAFTGAHAIYGVTDFWQFAQDPTTLSTAKATNKQPNQVCYDRELVQAKNIIDAAAHPTVLATLERFVFSTLSDTLKWSNGAITHNLHFDGKAAASAYLETTHPTLAARSSSLQVGFYMTNWSMAPAWRFTPRSNGPVDDAGRPLEWIIPTPHIEGRKHLVPFVHPPKDTGPFVRALVCVAAPGTTMLGTSSEASLEEWCDVWVRVMKERGLVAASATCVVDESVYTLEDVKGMMPGGFGDEVADSMLYVATLGWTGGDPSVKRPEACGVRMEELATLESYVREEDWSQIL